MSLRKMMSISKVEPELTQEAESPQKKSDALSQSMGQQESTAGELANTSDEDTKSIPRQLVDIEILYLLSFGPKRGYQLRKNLYTSFRLNLSYGTLYPHLHSLDEADLISGMWKHPSENAPMKKKM